jgi:hypothetical protein
MIKVIKKAIWRILIKLRIGGAIQLMLAGGLLDDGWFNSFNTKQSVDKNNKPIPWCTYSFIKFIEPRLKKKFSVFEYGSGNSTLWYAERVGSVKSVEHDQNWFNKNHLHYPTNVKAVFRTFNNDQAYANEINKDGTTYNIIIIDGVDRNNCVRCSINNLTEDGVIIYDNTQVPEYGPSIEFLVQNGFKRLDFEGLLPIVAHNNITSIFYRDRNCLGI